MYAWFERLIDAFAPDPYENEPMPTTMRGFYARFVKPVWPWLAVLAVLGFLVAAIDLLLVRWVGQLVDLAREAGPERMFSEHGALLLGMAVTALLLRPLFSFLHNALYNLSFMSGFTIQIRWRLHRRLLRQTLGFFQNDFAGRLSNRVMQTPRALRESLLQGIDAVWQMVVYFIGGALIMAESDWRLTAPLLLWAACYVGIMAHFLPRLRESSETVSHAQSIMTGRVVDSYTNILTVKLFARAGREDEYGREGMQGFLEAFRRQMRLITSMEAMLLALNGLALTSICGLALWLWTQDQATLGALATAAALTLRLTQMSFWIMFVVSGIFENLGQVSEGMQSFSAPIVLQDADEAKTLQVEKGEIRFEQVGFAYGAEKGGVRDLDLVIRPGERVGLVGRSGAGKSTLVNLLLRFYDVESGRILIDGQDIGKATQESLRGSISVVTQDNALMHRSVMDNILYGRPEAGAEAGIEAARRAQAHDFIQNLEDPKGRKGYQAHVGERGVKLSGGQRQRVTLARALLKNAPILVLDEATSALDSEVEAAIQEELEDLMAGKTVIAIAHRLSTIAHLDRIVVLEHGRIIEQGTHQELLALNGLYASFWARQSGGFLDLS
ncbi:ABC transporter ATP-binding protein [Neomegalonema sp.]|uniref:ABC transporter ATP-binding protein n=1 Tax=Neomegalonema sp. TaxID=2039713 RepID=UPI002621B71C|nr:ABC transporter ATP-binding protein [Neomegalonema sp.]MDD2869394.1 ABC transporter ATP-binding protein [Neomegalonema sp.]